MAYAKIENGQLTYATIKHGGIVVDGKMYFVPENRYNEYGYYPVENVMEDGQPTLVDGVIKNYIGAPVVDELQEKINSINGQLANTDPLIKALERLIAQNGATEEDKAMATARIALRDELGKVVQTDEGDGSAMNPYKWVDGKAVVANMWYKTQSDYIWMAIADGTPANETDTNYFDVVGLE